MPLIKRSSRVRKYSGVRDVFSNLYNNDDPPPPTAYILFYPLDKIKLLQIRFVQTLYLCVTEYRSFYLLEQMLILYLKCMKE